MRCRLLTSLVALLLLATGCGGGATGVGEAEWIWVSVPKRTVGAAAFYALKDFELERVPGTAVVRVVAEEEYVVYLNGRRVGSNRYRDGAPLDEYAVGELLHPGVNRLAVELRSARGYGGLLAALLDGDGRALVASDETWRIQRRHLPGLVEGRVPQGDGVAAFSWGRPPTGRWGMPERIAVRPTALAAGLDCAGRRPARRERSAPATVTFTWDPPVAGYVTVSRTAHAAGREATESALFLVTPETVADGAGGDDDFTSDPLTDPRAQPLLLMPSQVTWTDVVPRRVVTLVVAGLEGKVTASVLPVSPDALAELPRPTPGETQVPGLLGVKPPHRRTATQSEVRRRLIEEGEGIEAGRETDSP